MSIIEGFDTEKLVCTFCGEQPVVGFTFVVNAQSYEEAKTLQGLDEKSFIAVCKKHLPILQEQMEELQRDAEVEEVDIDSGEPIGEDSDDE
jgi:hypothetical protein